jgi:hypothetical protein
MAVLARSIFEFQLPPVRQLNVKTGLIHQCQLDCLDDGFSIRTILQGGAAVIPLRRST